MSEINASLEYNKCRSLDCGGDNKVRRQRAKGKLMARERINVLLDEESFEEIGIFAENFAPSIGEQAILGDGVVTGFGTINGEAVCVYSQDFTVMGGSLGEVHARKICALMDKAQESKMPIIGINDSGGARIQAGVSSLAGYGEIFYRNVACSGVVPQISVIAGPCAGGAVYSPSITDFIFMVQNTGYMFVTGPNVIKKVTYETVTQSDLGGDEVHSSVTGIADKVFVNDIAALLEVRDLLTYIPSHYGKSVAQIYTDDPVDRSDVFLDYVVPRNPAIPYDMLDVIRCICDEDMFFELKKDYAKNIIIGFGRIGGYSVGIVANQPIRSAGCLDINASCKAARFIRYCDSFDIPIITLIDVPGFLPGVSQEHGGIITHGAKLLYAYAEATVPKISIITRKAYGGAYIVMSSKHIAGDVNYAWSGSEIAVMGAEAATEILHKNADKDSVTDFVDDYRERVANPFVAAGCGFLDDIIYPRQTRKKIFNALMRLRNKKIHAPQKKHGNIPL